MMNLLLGAVLERETELERRDDGPMSSETVLRRPPDLP